MKTTINYRGKDFEVEYVRQAWEPDVDYHSDITKYPGSAENIEIKSVTHEKIDFTEFFLEYDDTIALFEDLVWEKIHEKVEV